VKQPRALRHLAPALASLRAQGLLREDRGPLPEGLSFCSNDYLGLARTGAAAAPGGAGASRLVDGDRAEHRALEKALASWLDADAALCFSSGYAANVGALSALVQPGDRVVSDARNHASIIDGIRLSRGDVRVVAHNDLAAVRVALERPAGQRAWVVTESYFSMDADTPDLAGLRALCDEMDAALVVDEAHAIGVLGPQGRGLCADRGITPDVLVGTLGKALGAAGAFVAGSETLRTWLWNRARSFVFSTGLAPVVAATALRNLRDAQAADDLRATVAARASELRAGLRERGVDPPGYGHVVPWILGEPARATEAAARLREQGFLVQAIRPPSVPQGTARLRLTASARQSADDIRALFECVDRVLPWVRRSS
jgi:8-amino-7-oxononanoate synthase